MFIIAIGLAFSVLLSSFEAVFKRISEVELKPQKTMIGYFDGMAVDSKDNLLVVDHSGRHVLIFNQNGAHIGNIGGGGRGPGEFEQPVGVFVSSTGEIYVSDNSVRRVSVFDKNYRYIRSFLIRTDHWVPRCLRVHNGFIYMAAPQIRPPAHLTICTFRNTIPSESS